MNILINDEKLDYKLEDEKSLADILKSLEDWVFKHGSVIESVYVDKNTVPLDFRSEELSREVSSVHELRIMTSPKVGLALDTIKTVGEYIITVFDEYLDSQIITHYDSILEAMNLIYEGTQNSLRVLNIRDLVVINSQGDSLREILGELKESISLYEKKYIDADDSDQLGRLLKRLLLILPKIVKWSILKNSLLFNSHESLEISFLKTVFGDLQKLSHRSLHKFEKISENLQIGRDINALNDLYYITEIFDELIYILQLSVNIFDIDMSTFGRSDTDCDLFKELSSGLKDVEESFINGDMVSVGDMIEYEIRPLFEDLVGLIGRIDEFIR